MIAAESHSKRTEIKLNKYDCEWVIENVGRCREATISSPVFISKDGLTQWVLDLKGYDETDDSDFLICETWNFELRVTFSPKSDLKKWIWSCSVKLDNNAELFYAPKNTLSKEFSTERDDIEPIIIHLNQILLTQPEQTSLIIRVVLESTEVMIPPSPLVHKGDLKKNNQKLQQSQMGALFDNAQYGDVTFVLENTTFLAYKGILATRSPVFEAMFRNNLTESQQGRVVISDIDDKTFEVLLRFIYTGDLENLNTTAFDLLLAAADKYRLDDLKEHCEMELCRALTVETLPKLLVLADLHCAAKLKTTAIQFVKTNHAVLGTEDWLTTMKNYPELSNDIMRQVFPPK